MTRSNDWTWEFRRPVTQVFEGLDAPIQQRIVSKLDDIVTDEWRDPPEHVEPLSGVPHGKTRIGDFRFGADADPDREVVVIYDIEYRSGAYRSGDD